MPKLKEEYGYDSDFEDYGVENQETGEYTDYKGGAKGGAFPRESQKESGRKPLNK